MKKNRRKIFIEEIQKNPNISLAAEKTGLSRQTIYRWMGFEPKFKRAVDAAISSGINHVNDLAKSKLINKIQAGEFKPIKYWLDNNDPNFYSPKFVAERKERQVDKQEEKASIMNIMKTLKIKRRAEADGVEINEDTIDDYL